MTLQVFKCCQGNSLNLFSCLFDSGLVEGAATDLGSSMPSGLGRGALRLPANARTACFMLAQRCNTTWDDF